MADKKTIDILIRANADSVKKTGQEIDGVFGRMGQTVKNAFSGSSTGMNKTAADMKKLRDGFGLTAQEATNLSFQINDVVSGLATGQNSFTVLMQQGPQITQIFGGVAGTFARLTPIILRLSPAFLAIGAAVAGLKGVSMGEAAGKELNDLRINADQAGVPIKALQQLLAQGAGEDVNIEKIAAGYERMRDSALNARDAQTELQKSRDDALKAMGPINSTAPDFAKKMDDLDEKFKGKDIFSKLKISLAGFNGSSEQTEALARRVIASINSIGDAFKRNELEREAEQAFGEDYIRVLKNASSETAAFKKTYDDFIKSFDYDKAAEAAKKQQTSANHLAQLRKKMSDAENSVFIGAAEAKDTFLTNMLLRNEKSVEGYISFLQGVSGTIQDFFGILQGDQAAAKSSPVLAGIVAAVSEVARVFKSAYGEVKGFFEAFGASDKAITVIAAMETGVKTLYNVFYSLFSQISDLSRKTFGVDIPADVLMAGAILFKFVNPLNIVKGLLGGLMRSPFALWAVGLAAATMYIDKIEAGLHVAAAGIANLGLEFLKLNLYREKASAWWNKDEKKAKSLSNQIEEINKLQSKGWKDALDHWGKKTKYDDMSSADALKARWEDAKKMVEDGAPKIKNAVKNAFDIDVDAEFNKFKKGIDDASKYAVDRTKQSAEKIEQTVTGGMHPERIDAKAAKFVSPNQNAPSASDGAFADRAAAEFGKSVHAPGATDSGSTGGSAIAQPYREMTKAAQEAVKAGAEAQKVSDAAAVTIRTPKDLQTGVTGSVYKDKAGKEGIDNALYPSMKLEIDQVETGAKKVTDESQKSVSLWDSFQEAAKAVDTAIAQIKMPDFSSAAAQLGQMASDTAQIARNLAAAGQSALSMPSASANPSSAFQPTAKGYASGGHVRGPGSGRSDSILAWLSNGEYVVNAAAVQAIGLGALHAINSGGAGAFTALGLTAGAVAAPGFADGGFVGGYSPPGGLAAVAGASSNAGGGNVTLVIDNKPHGPFSGSGADIDALSRAAVANRMTRTSKVPSRVG
jgi:Prophage tail length tape measure protein